MNENETPKNVADLSEKRRNVVWGCTGCGSQAWYMCGTREVQCFICGLVQTDIEWRYKDEH